MASDVTMWLAGGVLVLGLVAGAAYGLVALDRPQIESIDNEWGTVTAERTAVESRVVVDNPLLLRLGDRAANVRYSVSLNGVRLASGQKRQVDLAGRENAVHLRTWIDNDDIPRWWVTHVNQNETTRVRVDPDVVLEYGGVDIPARPWTRNRTVRTDLLAPLQTDRTRRLRALNRTLLVVNGTDARWGHATAARTPIRATATVTNPTPVPLPVTQLDYEIRMNGVVVGRGTAARETVVPPGETRTLRVRAHLDNSRLDEWWVTHVRNGERSRLVVDVAATVEYGGVRRRLPLEFLSYERTFSTHVFADGGNASAAASVAPAADRPAPAPIAAE